MGKTKFVFNNMSGTLEPEEQAFPTNDDKIVTSQPQENNVAEIKRNNHVETDENVIQFRESSDYTVFQVVNEENRKPMMIIAGYALEIKFNMAELRSTEKIEQSLGGLTSMFRKMILEQALGK